MTSTCWHCAAGIIGSISDEAFIYIYIYIVITVSFPLVFVCLVSTGPEHVDDNRGIYLSKAQTTSPVSKPLTFPAFFKSLTKQSWCTDWEFTENSSCVWVRWYFAEQSSFCVWERERGGVSSALVFSPSFRRAVPACCTELQGNASPCISALCTTCRSDCVGCSVGTAATVYTSFFFEWHKSAPQLAFVPI